MEWLAPVAASVVAALGGWAYNRHRPKVDRDATYITGSNQLIDQLQEELAVVRARVDRLEDSNAQLRGELAQQRGAHDHAVAQNVAFEGLTEGLVARVHTLCRPWPVVPPVLADRVRPFPSVPVVAHDGDHPSTT